MDQCTIMSAPMKVIPRPELSDDQFIQWVDTTIKNTIEENEMIQKDDRLLVAVSGGKDSTIVLHVLKKLGYPVTAFTVDVRIGCYTEENLQNIRAVCKDHNISLHEADFRKEFGYSVCYLRSMLNDKGHNLKSCTVCGVLRRYLINRECRKLGATKVITGHNLDDEAQAVVMNLFRNTPELSARLGPRPGIVKDEKFVPRIKPLYFLTNREIERYSRIMNFPCNYGHCPCSTDSFRRSVKEFLNQIEESSPGTKRAVITNFLKILPALKNKYAKIADQSPESNAINACDVCGESSKSNTCRTCQLLESALGKMAKPQQSSPTVV